MPIEPAMACLLPSSLEPLRATVLPTSSAAVLVKHFITDSRIQINLSVASYNG